LIGDPAFVVGTQPAFTPGTKYEVNPARGVLTDNEQRAAWSETSACMLQGLDGVVDRFEIEGDDGHGTGGGTAGRVWLAAEKMRADAWECLLESAGSLFQCRRRGTGEK
jgi:hypothetical protein